MDPYFRAVMNMPDADKLDFLQNYKIKYDYGPIRNHKEFDQNDRQRAYELKRNESKEHLDSRKMKLAALMGLQQQ